MSKDAVIRERAYRIWEQEGRLHGNDIEHWLRAQAEISLNYLLDTNAMISLCKAESILSKFHYWKFCVSPYVFWERFELLFNLNDNTDFQQVNTELQKFRHTRVLNDPRAIIEEDDKHISDAELITKALDALNGSTTLEDFYCKQIKDSRGNIRQLRGSVDRNLNELKRREEKYLIFITQIMKKLRGSFTHKQILQMTDETKHNCILALTKGLVGVDDPRHSYLYFGYMFHRALRFIRDGKTIPAKHDCNDYEDSKMCLHLRLDGLYCFVTNDDNVKQALTKTAALMQRINHPEWQSSLQICCTEYLRQLVE